MNDAFVATSLARQRSDSISGGTSDCQPRLEEFAALRAAREGSRTASCIAAAQGETDMPAGERCEGAGVTVIAVRVPTSARSSRRLIEVALGACGGDGWGAGWCARGWLYLSRMSR